MLKLNLDTQTHEFKICLQKWKKRNLNTLGKVTVIKSCALPKVIYPLTSIETPSPETIVDLQKTMNEFIWGSKLNKIRHKTIILNYENGGIK